MLLTRDLIAVPDRFDKYSTAVRTAGDSATTVANLAADDQRADGAINITTPESEFSISETKARLTWQVRSASSQEPVITATRRKSHTFDLDEGGTRFELKLNRRSRSDSSSYEVHRIADGDKTKPELVCTIEVESVHAWSYRLRCNDVIGIRIPLFCFFLVSMLKMNCSRLGELRSPTSRIVGITAPLRELYKAIDAVFAAA